METLRRSGRVLPSSHAVLTQITRPMETDLSFRLVAVTIILGVVLALATAAHPIRIARLAPQHRVLAVWH